MIGGEGGGVYNETRCGGGADEVERTPTHFRPTTPP